MTKQNTKWLDCLQHNPLSILVDSNNMAIRLRSRTMLLDEIVPEQDLWSLVDVKKIVKKQRSDGSWKYATNKDSSRVQGYYDQYETWRNLSFLVEMYGLTNNHTAIIKAAEYFFSHQTEEGDFRGIYARQYSPNYSASIAELLIKAGYANDPRIENHFKWLLSIRQNDGGWALPFRTRGQNLSVIYNDSPTIQPDLNKPYSYMVTGVVLRCFAAHSRYKNSKEAKLAGNLLLQRFFKRDSYPDRVSVDCWLKFSFPFDYTSLVSALDSLSLLGFSADNPKINNALSWFIDNQSNDGSWNLKIVRGGKADLLDLWLTLAICRVFKQFYS